MVVALVDDDLMTGEMLRTRLFVRCDSCSSMRGVVVLVHVLCGVVLAGCPGRERGSATQ